jgi:CBS-domain-containing membrane protein
MLSELAGELISVKDTVPTGFEAVPVAMSVTVIVNCVEPPIGAEALVGAIVVVVARAVTVSAAFPLLPACRLSFGVYVAVIV